MSASFEIGLSGLGTPGQAMALRQAIAELPGRGWTVALGFSTTVLLEPSMELWERPRLYVAPNRLANLVAAYPEAVWTAHLTLVKRVSLLVQMERLKTVCGSSLRAVQINNPRTNIAEIANATSYLPDVRIIFPIGRSSMRQAVLNRLAFHARISQLVAVGVSELLLDNSAGKAEPLALAELVSCLQALKRWPELTVRIAGRLGEDLEVVEQLLGIGSVATRLDGWEVESRLRDAYDAFEVAAAQSVLWRSIGIIQNALSAGVTNEPPA